MNAKDSVLNNQDQNISNQEIFEHIDKAVLTLFNEPSLGLYFTQQHIENSIPKIINRTDNLQENRKKLLNMKADVESTIINLKELTTLNENFSYNMLAIINNLNFEVKKLKEKNSS